MDPGLVIASWTNVPLPGGASAAIGSSTCGHPFAGIARGGRGARVPIIEDASEALGATYVGGLFDGRHVGTSVGWARSASTGTSSSPLAVGDAVTDDEALARRALADAGALTGAAVTQIGYNYRLSNISAALSWPARAAARFRRPPNNAAGYDAAIADLPALHPAPRRPWADSSFWLYTAALDPTVSRLDRDALLAALAREDIEARPIWTPLHRTLYRDAAVSVARGRRHLRCRLQPAFVVNLGQARLDRVVGVLRGLLADRLPPPPRLASPVDHRSLGCGTIRAAQRRSGRRLRPTQ
jgi:dTDP-4-amino-4,6-dideoxygalactose transaminase